MANQVDGVIAINIPINARSEVAFKKAVDATSTAVRKSILAVESSLDAGSSFGEANEVVSRTTAMFAPSEPVEATPAKATRAVKKRGGKKKVTKRAPKAAGAPTARSIAQKKAWVARKAAAKKAPTKKKAGRRRS